MKETGKRILALVMALCLTLALGTTALAAAVTGIEVTSEGAQAGKAITQITVTIEGGGTFATPLSETAFTVNGSEVGLDPEISGVSVTSGAGSNSATLSLNCTPTKAGDITVTAKAEAFQDGGQSYSNTFHVNPADPPEVSASASGLQVGKEGSITLSIQDGKKFASSLDQAMFTLKETGEKALTPSIESGQGTGTATLKVTPTVKGTITISIGATAFEYQPEESVTPNGTVEVSLGAEVSAQTSGELTVGEQGEIKVTATGSNFASTSPDVSLFTLSGGGVTQPKSVTATGNTATLTVTPIQQSDIRVTKIDPSAFVYAPDSDVVPSSQATVNAPSGTLKAELVDGKLYEGTPAGDTKIKLSFENGTLKFKQTPGESAFTLDKDLTVKSVSVDTAQNTATLTIEGTPSESGNVTITADKDKAFEYAPDTSPEAQVTVEAAPTVTLNSTSIVAGTTNEVKITIGSGDANFASVVTPSTLTVGGDEFSGLTVSKVTPDGKNATLTLSAVPDKTGNMTITVPKEAFNPVASAAVTATIEVQAPSGSVTATLAGSPGTLTAGVEAGNTTIQLSAAGSTLNFTNNPSTGYFTLEKGTGELGTLTVSGAAGSGKTVTLSLTGIPKKQGTFKVKIGQGAFVASPGQDLTATGELTINYPTVTVTPDPNFIAEDDETATSIKLKATGSVFNATDEMAYFQISGVSGNITLTGVHADANSDTATLTISGTATGEGTLTITIQPDAFVYKPESDVKATIQVGKPTGTLTATQNGKLYKGTPVSGQTITVNITKSHGLHFKADLTAGDFGLTGASAGLTIKEAKFVNTLEATLTLEGTPEQNGVFQVKALTNAFHVAPAGEQPATGDITVEDAPTGSVTAALSGPLYAGTPADGTTVTLTATGLTFASPVNKSNFGLTTGSAGMTIADVKLSGGQIVLTLSGTPAAAGTFQVEVANSAFTVYPTAVVSSNNITVGAANIKLALSDNGLQAGKTDMTFKVTPSGGKLIDLANRAAAIDTGADLDGLTLGDMTQNADGSVTVAIMGMPPVAGSITITFQASMFAPQPEGPVSLTVPVAEGEQAAEPETKPGAPGIGFTAPMDELAASVLTPEEQALYEKGAQVLIELVESPDAQVPEADKTIVTAAAGEYTVGEYLDVSLIKTINGVSDTVSETNRAIRVVFTIPTDLQAAGRQFAVIRVHDGKAEFLKTVSSTASTITVESDRFSTYAIVYREAPATATPAPTQTSTATPAPTDSVPDTGDDTALPGWTALLLGCAAALTAAVLTLRRKDRRG